MPPAKPAAKPAAKAPVRTKRAATSAAKTDVSAKKATVPAPKPAAPARLQFVFTKTSFRIDHPEWVLDDAEETLKKQFQENRARALFSLGFSDPAKAESTSLAFLRQVSTEFMKALTDMPELELARENTEVSLSYETSGRLLNSVPFGLGTEYITDAYLRKLPARAKLLSRLKEVVNYEKVGAPSHEKNGKWYFFKNDGLQNQSVLYEMDTLGGEAKVLLDPNTLSEDGTVALKGTYFSGDGKYMAYVISRSGSDWEEIFVMDVESGALLDDHIVWAKFTGASWRGDGFYYSAYDAPEENGHEFSGKNEGHKIYYHKIGTPQAEDELFFSNPAEPLRFYQVSLMLQLLFIQRNAVMQVGDQSRGIFLRKRLVNRHIVIRTLDMIHIVSAVDIDGAGKQESYSAGFVGDLHPTGIADALTFVDSPDNSFCQVAQQQENSKMQKYNKPFHKRKKGRNQAQNKQSGCYQVFFQPGCSFVKILHSSQYLFVKIHKGADPDNQKGDQQKNPKSYLMPPSFFI